MKHSLSWIEKFIAPDKQTDVALLSSEKQFETLCLLIESGKIDATIYLAWASQTFLLPSLDSEFFAKVDVQSVWKKYSSLNFWTSEIFPVGEYENRVMIATYAPPIDFKASFPELPVFVLASPIDLKQTWKKLNPKVDVATPPIVLAAPTPVVVVAPTPDDSSMHFNMKMDPNFQVVDLSVGSEAKPEEISPPPTEKEMETPNETLNGMNIDLDFTKSVAPNFSFGAPKSIKEEKPDMAPPAQAAAPIAPPPLPPPPPPQQVSYAVKAPIPTLVAPKPIVASEGLRPMPLSAPVPPPPLPKTPPPQAKPVGPPPQSKPVGPPLSKTIEPEAVKPPAPIFIQPNSVPSQFAHKSLSYKSEIKRDLTHAQSSFEECSTYAEAADVMFSKMLPQFEMSMLLICEDQNLRPLFWSGNFKIADEQKPSLIALQQVSIFKIVHASGKPYHGYLIANHTNSKFFADWNSGEIPKHVTIIPIFVNKYLVGMWLGATNNSIDLKTSLNDMDSLTDQSVTAVQKLIKSAA